MLVELGKECLFFFLGLGWDLLALILDILCNSFFIYMCRVLLITVDIFCNFLYPAYETLFFLAKFRRKE